MVRDGWFRASPERANQQYERPKASEHGSGQLSLRLADRKKGKVWEFLWREVQLDGSIRRKHIVIGTLEDFPTESAAQAGVDAIRLEINRQTPQKLVKNVSFETLVNHYRQHELPDVFNKTKPAPDAADEDSKSYSTQVKVTTDVYTQAVWPQKREAQSNLVKLVRRGSDSEAKSS